MILEELLTFSIKNNASDLHLSAGVPPTIRVDGELSQLEMPILTHQDILHMLYELMDEKNRFVYEQQKEIDFALEVPQGARFRINAFNQMRGASAAIRIIPAHLPNLEQLEFPLVFKQIAHYSHGLVLITGPTGSGKSTTLAALIDYINRTFYHHILTIEDPIEFVHQNQRCLISQREVHRDTTSFHAALRAGLREDPDTIIVGELRDLETIRLALTAAETGHLVFATLHTSSASKAINRIIDVFPGTEQSLVRSMLSESLQAIIAQTLLKKITKGRIAALEIMTCNTAIRHLIRENKLAQIYSAIQTGQAAGMQTLDQHLIQLVKNQIIEKNQAKTAALNKDLFV